MLITSSNIDECHVLKSIPIAKLQICIELKTINMQINQACCFYSLFRSRVFCFVSSGQNHNRTHHTRVCSMSTTELKTTTTTTNKPNLCCAFSVSISFSAQTVFSQTWPVINNCWNVFVLYVPLCILSIQEQEMRRTERCYDEGRH